MKGEDSMILADKIINLRKKNGWSQEDLAEKLNVSRQSVSKWEGAQSTPDLQRIIEMSKIFGVTTDYLIKDELEIEEVSSEEESTSDYSRRVSLIEANEYLGLVEETSRLGALAASLIIISPIILLLLLGGVSQEYIVISEDMAAVGGIVVLLIMIAIGVGIFVKNENLLKEYEFLDSEPIYREYGVEGLAREKKMELNLTKSKYVIIAVALFILSPIPVLISGISGENEFLILVSVSILLFMVAMGVNILIRITEKEDSYDKLLEEGDYTLENKSKSSVSNHIFQIYWLVVLSIYLGYSLITGNWGVSWVIWPVAGILSGAVSGLINLGSKDK